MFFHQSSIVDELTNANPVQGFVQSKQRMVLNHLAPKVMMDPDRLSVDAHIWHEDRYVGELFVSDELYSRMLALGVKRDWSKPDAGGGSGGAGTQFSTSDT